MRLWLKRLWRPMAPHLRTGAEGERLARRHLKKRGYRIVETNVRLKIGEIDIVAEEGGALVFVEVKTRREGDDYSPFLSVTPGKRKKLIALARLYCARKRIEDRSLRFDLVGISMAGAEPKVTLLQNAFGGPRR
jgi:putative endonuclease